MEFFAERVKQISCGKCGAHIDPAATKPLSTAKCPKCDADVVVPAQFKDFLLLKQLGQGSNGVVFKALDQKLHRQVAIKALVTKDDDEQSALECVREARILARLNHGNIVQIYGLDEHRSQHFIIMELLTRGSADQLINPSRQPSERRILDLAIAVAGGLSAAHRAGLVHMDIKPENILFDAEGTPKLIDFGAAQFRHRSKDEGVVGTPYYIAPETARGKDPDYRSDMYSLGATLFHLLTGRPPFEAENATQVIARRLKETAPSILTDRRDVSLRTAQIIERLLERDPEQRPGSYEELIDDLTQARAAIHTDHDSVDIEDLPTVELASAFGNPMGRSTSARTAVATRTLVAGTQRTGLRWWLSGAAVFVLLLVGGIVWVLQNGTDPPPTPPRPPVVVTPPTPTPPPTPPVPVPPDPPTPPVPSPPDPPTPPAPTAPPEANPIVDSIDGLIARWAFDRTQGKSIQVDVGPEIKATLRGPAAYDTGVGGDGLVFNGTNNFLAVPDTAINPAGGSVSGWFRVTDPAPGQTIFGTDSKPSRYYVRVEAGQLAGRVGTAEEPFAAGGTIHAGHWQHFAMTWTSQGPAELYLDGELVGSGDAGQLSVPRKANFGSFAQGGNSYFKGAMDDLRIYERSLSLAEIKAIAQREDKIEARDAPLLPRPTVGLVGHWKLDRLNGGKFLDASGHNLHGLITGSMTTTAGRVGQAAQFDGRSYIEIPEHRLLENLSRQFSISLWFQCDKFTRDFQTLVARGDRTWRVQRDAKHPHLSFDLTGITSPQSDRWGNARLVGKTNVQDGQWHHLVTVYSGQKAQIYVDGRLEAEMPASGAVPFDAQPLRIGSNSQVGNREFLGLIDEVRLYDEAISLEQVLELLKQGGGKVPVPTVVVKPPTTPNGDPVKLAETGRILVERWDRVGGNGNIDHVFRHIGANPTPAVTDYYTQLESPTGQGNNFGRRIKGWLHPPATGPYTFRVEADDRGDLYLSTDHDPSNKRRIARTNQNSQPIQLETGRAYYVEAYHAQDVGPAFVRVKWTRPDRVNEVIPGSALSVAYREIPDHEKGFEVLRPAQLASAKGTKLTVQDDGSIMDVGDAKSIKQGDTFTVTLHPRFTGITALRIETLPDRVFGGAAGRGPGGIFAVSELQATWAPKKTPSAALPLKFIRSTCEGDEAKYEIAQALDGNPATVWAARKAMGKARTATLVLKEPIAGTEEGVLTVTLVNKFNLGRFRISASTATDISRILEEERRPDPLALDEALIAHWTFDKDAGLTANALKFTPHFKGRVNKSRGQIDGALKFDQNTHIDVDGGQRLNLGRQDFTLAAWIKTREGGTILAKTPTGKWASQGKAFFVGQGKLKFDLGHVGVVAGKSTVGDDQWHHVALTYELKTKHLRLYVDGKEDGGNRMPQMNADPADHVLRIGYTTTDFPKEPTSHLKGLLDDLRIYKRTLSAEEMSALAGSAGPAVAVTPPVTPAGTEDELEKPGRIANLIYNQQRVNGDLNRLIALVEKGEKPNQEATCTSFNDGSTNNKKAGQVIRGYLHPPVTGDYTFILQVDDTGRLSVSSDHTQENAKIVARREGGNPPPEATSIHMEAGQVYFVQALGVNTGGGGFLRVLWKRPDGKQEIIPGQYLSIAHRKIPDHEQGFEVLQPTQVASVKGTKLTVQDDGSIMDAGDAKSLRQSDTFTIQLQPEFDGITAFRLETVPDPAFRGGAGRGPGGMFAVAEIQATWAAKAKPDAATPLRFKMAISGTEEPGYQAIRAVDGNPATLWAVRKTVGHPHRATLILEEPIGKAKDSVVTFTIINKFNLGRFRIAASTIPEAKRLTEMALADGKDPPAAGGADPSVPDGPYSKNINLGGGRQRVGRILWVDSPKYKEGETDFGHVGGGKVEFKEGIKDVLAQSAINQIKGYRLKVPNGKYSIRMLFAEHWTNHAGERIFDVAVEGKTVARDFDLIKAARGKHRSLWAPPITSEVKDNLLEIDFKPTKNHALLSALRVERIGGLRPPK